MANHGRDKSYGFTIKEDSSDGSEDLFSLALLVNKDREDYDVEEANEEKDQVVQPSVSFFDNSDVAPRARSLAASQEVDDEIAAELHQNEWHVIERPLGKINLTKCDIFQRQLEPHFKNKLDDGKFGATSSSFLLEHPTVFEQTESVKSATLHYLRRYFGVNTSLENLTLAGGYGAGLDMCAYILFSPGDVVLCASPFSTRVLQSFEERCQVELRPVPFQDLFNVRLEVDAFQIAYYKAISKQKTVRGIFVQNFCRSTGSHFAHSDVSALCEWACSKDLWIVFDELATDDVTAKTSDTRFSVARFLADSSADTRQRCVCIWCPSEDLCLPGMQFSVVYADNARVCKALRRLAVVQPCAPLVQTYMLRLLNDLDQIDAVLKAKQNRLALNREFVLSRLEQIKVPYVTPSSGFFIFIDLRSFIRSDKPRGERRLWRKLWHSGIYLNPGSLLGAAEAGWFQINVTLERITMIKGLEVLERVITHQKRVKHDNVQTPIDPPKASNSDLVSAVSTTDNSSTPIASIVNSVDLAVYPMSPDPVKYEAEPLNQNIDRSNFADVCHPTRISSEDTSNLNATEENSNTPAERDILHDSPLRSLDYLQSSSMKQNDSCYEIKRVFELDEQLLHKYNSSSDNTGNLLQNNETIDISIYGGLRMDQNNETNTEDRKGVMLKYDADVEAKDDENPLSVSHNNIENVKNGFFESCNEGFDEFEKKEHVDKVDDTVIKTHAEYDTLREEVERIENTTELSLRNPFLSEELLQVVFRPFDSAQQRHSASLMSNNKMKGDSDGSENVRDEILRKVFAIFPPPEKWDELEDPFGELEENNYLPTNSGELSFRNYENLTRLQRRLLLASRIRWANEQAAKRHNFNVSRMSAISERSDLSDMETSFNDSGSFKLSPNSGSLMTYEDSTENELTFHEILKLQNKEESIEEEITNKTDRRTEDNENNTNVVAYEAQYITRYNNAENVQEMNDSALDDTIDKTHDEINAILKKEEDVIFIELEKLARQTMESSPNKNNDYFEQEKTKKENFEERNVKMKSKERLEDVELTDVASAVSQQQTETKFETTVNEDYTKSCNDQHHTEKSVTISDIDISCKTEQQSPSYPENRDTDGESGKRVISFYNFDFIKRLVEGDTLTHDPNREFSDEILQQVFRPFDYAHEHNVIESNTIHNDQTYDEQYDSKNEREKRQDEEQLTNQNKCEDNFSKEKLTDHNAIQKLCIEKETCDSVSTLDRFDQDTPDNNKDEHKFSPRHIDTNLKHELYTTDIQYFIDLLTKDHKENELNDFTKEKNEHEHYSHNEQKERLESHEHLNANVADQRQPPMWSPTDSGVPIESNFSRSSNASSPSLEQNFSNEKLVMLSTTATTYESHLIDNGEKSRGTHFQIFLESLTSPSAATINFNKSKNDANNHVDQFADYNLDDGPLDTSTLNRPSGNTSSIHEEKQEGDVYDEYTLPLRGDKQSAKNILLNSQLDDSGVFVENNRGSICIEFPMLVHKNTDAQQTDDSDKFEQGSAELSQKIFLEFDDECEVINPTSTLDKNTSLNCLNNNETTSCTRKTQKEYHGVLSHSLDRSKLMSNFKDKYSHQVKNTEGKWQSLTNVRDDDDNTETVEVRSTTMITEFESSTAPRFAADRARTPPFSTASTKPQASEAMEIIKLYNTSVRIRPVPLLSVSTDRMSKNEKMTDEDVDLSFSNKSPCCQSQDYVVPLRSTKNIQLSVRPITNTQSISENADDSSYSFAENKHKDKNYNEMGISLVPHFDELINDMNYLEQEMNDETILPHYTCTIPHKNDESSPHISDNQSSSSTVYNEKDWTMANISARSSINPLTTNFPSMKESRRYRMHHQISMTRKGCSSTILDNTIQNNKETVTKTPQLINCCADELVLEHVNVTAIDCKDDASVEEAEKKVYASASAQSDSLDDTELFNQIRLSGDRLWNQQPVKSTLKKDYSNYYTIKRVTSHELDHRPESEDETTIETTQQASSSRRDFGVQTRKSGAESWCCRLRMHKTKRKSQPKEQNNKSINHAERSIRRYEFVICKNPRHRMSRDHCNPRRLYIVKQSTVPFENIPLSDSTTRRESRSNSKIVLPSQVDIVNISHIGTDDRSNSSPVLHTPNLQWIVTSVCRSTPYDQKQTTV